MNCQKLVTTLKLGDLVIDYIFGRNIWYCGEISSYKRFYVKNDKALQWLSTLSPNNCDYLYCRLLFMSDSKFGRDIFLLTETSVARFASGGPVRKKKVSNLNLLFIYTHRTPAIKGHWIAELRLHKQAKISISSKPQNNQSIFPFTSILTVYQQLEHWHAQTQDNLHENTELFAIFLSLAWFNSSGNKANFNTAENYIMAHSELNLALRDQEWSYSQGQIILFNCAVQKMS